MEFKKIDINSPGFKEAWHIIESSFPNDERRTRIQQREVSKKDNYSFITVFDNELVGIITAWNFDDFIFVEHFVVKKEFRNKGYGTKILKELEKRYNKIILEMEFPKTDMQKKRAGFYQMAGLMLNPYPYKQPPYSEHKKHVDCLIMSYPDKISEEEFNKIRETLHKEVYNLDEPLI